MPIRDFVPNDYAAIIAIRNAIFPDVPMSVEQLRGYVESLEPKYQVRSWIAEHEGRVIGYSSYERSPWFDHPHHYFLIVWVHPDFQGRGHGSMLYDRVNTALEAFNPVLMTTTREDQPRALRWLEQRGFNQTSRLQRSVLDLAGFDPSPWIELEASLRASGITIKSVLNLQSADPDWASKLHALYLTVSADVPGYENMTPPSFEQWKKSVLDSPTFNPLTFLIAVDGEQYVGLTELSKNDQTNDLFTGLTGVLRDYHRRGIATALKVRALAWAKDHGYAHIQTENADPNPMLQLNYRLGFKDASAWLTYRKVFPET